MKLNELRIGNLVQTKGNGVFVFHLDTDDRDRINYIGAENYEGFPLTEEWLLRFGFKTDEWRNEFELDTINLDNEYTDKGEWNLFLKGKNIKPLESKNEYVCHYYPKIEIKYVHQLQNLYFALTGEELTIKK